MSSDSAEVLKTPEWLDVLENKRKRTHKLAHEIGAGAPCLVCKEACKGLNLHFWRKLCIECKCRKEDHDVEEEDDYAQFEILFGAKKVRRTTLKFNAQNKSFDWIPPNVPQDLVVDYLKSIPESKVPISNSEGARYRKQQLEKQLPLHDVDPNACHNLSEKETKEFQKYLDNLKNSVIGQGKIFKYSSAKMLKENYIQDSLTNMVASSEKYGNIKPQGSELCGHRAINILQEQTAFSQDVSFIKYPIDESIYIDQPEYSQLTGTQVSQPLKSHFLERHSNFGNQVAISEGPKLFGKGFLTETKSGQDITTKALTNVQETSLGFQTPSCFTGSGQPHGDIRNNNENNISTEDNVNGNETRSVVANLPTSQHLSKGTGIGRKHLPEAGQNICQPHDFAFRDTLNKFQELNVRSSEVPFCPVQGTSMITKQNKQTPGNNTITTQLGDHEDPYDAFPTPPVTCKQCMGILNPDDVVVQTDQGGNLALWHAKCFICETCKELLVDLMYFFHKGKVFCGRHYAEIINIPRCYACDELIFVKEYTCAEGVAYHVRHFCCFHCDQPLGGKQYIPKDSQPVCLDCYQVKYGKVPKNAKPALFPSQLVNNGSRGKTSISMYRLSVSGAPNA
ncbi:hypothetical protein RUM44_013826 [Polyplax serrata]|uniref:Testin n=1 Tax=Polyplax serrata TaxID=468196 RepID=A0ABR1BF89_POLSC